MSEPVLAGELRAAAVALRVTAQVSPALAEPLASLLEDLRRLAVTHRADPGYAGMPEHRWCTGCQDEECDALQLLDRAREVVQALNGSGGAR